MGRGIEEVQEMNGSLMQSATKAASAQHIDMPGRFSAGERHALLTWLLPRVHQREDGSVEGCLSVDRTCTCLGDVDEAHSSMLGVLHCDAARKTDTTTKNQCIAIMSPVMCTSRS